MSQKNIPKGGPGSSRTVPKPTSSTTKITQSKAKTVKSEEKVERKPISMTNKNVKHSVKATNTGIDRKTNVVTTERKTDREIVSKTKTKTPSKPLSKNLNTKPVNQTNIKPNDTNRKLISSKNNEIPVKRTQLTTKKNVTNADKKQTSIQKNEHASKKKDIVTQKKQGLITKVENNTQNTIQEIQEKQMESEDQTNKESSDEQYVSLATLESYSSYKRSHKTSESIQAEPPSICDTDIEDMANNITDNQINDDFPSDYCDDFEDYESDFEDDEEDDPQEDEEEGEQEQKLGEKETEQEFHDSHQDLHQRRSNSIVKYDNHYNEILFEERASQLKETNSPENDLTRIQIPKTKPNDSKQTLSQSVQNAKIKSEFEIQRSRTMKRSKELLEIIKLDKISFTNFDLPQINYQLFIKTFGRKDTKQVRCQTSERENSETQTDFIQMSDKWTQNPSFTRLVSGDQNQMDVDNLSKDVEPKVNPFEMIQFLMKAETLMSAIIDIECDNPTISKRSLPKGAEQFSTNVSVIKCLSLAKKCSISYTFTNSLYIFCVQNVSKILGSAEKSMISVWSLMSDKTEPVRILICRSHIVKALCEQHLVISAMIDGSVALWDLNQQSICDKELLADGTKFTLRTPTYNCALTSKGHDYPIVDIKRLFDSESIDRLNHFGTIDENGFMNVWAVTEGKEETNDSPLSQTNEHKIIRISLTNYLTKFDFESNSVKITAMECQPNDWSNFYCGTDNGLVIRYTNIEESVNNLPKMYQKSHLNSIWTKVSIISFNKSEISKFLVAFTDGLLSYYSITNENPLIVFNSNEISIIDLKWIPTTSQMSFIALNNSNQIFIWDMNSEQQFKPIIKYRHSNDRILSLNLWKGYKTYLIFGCDSGQTLIFDFRI